MTTFNHISFAFFIAVLTISSAWSQTISTVAGTGAEGYSGDGGPAITAQIYYPVDVEVDRSGTIYISDRLNHRIRKVDENGTITTIAGTGTGGYSGDNGPATSAQINYPDRIALDHIGNLYIADEINNCVRKIDTSGIITTFAGAMSPYGDFSGDGGPATSARLNQPSGIAVDSEGNVFIADRLNHRIRKVDVSGTISTIAGNGVEDVSDGAPPSGAGGYSGDHGPATSAQLNYPSDILLDSTGNLYIADASNFRIRKVDPNGIITTFAGSGDYGFSGDGELAIDADMTHPYGLEMDRAGNLYFSDLYNARVRKINEHGIISTIAGTGTYGYNGDNIQATSAHLNKPNGIAMDQFGNLFIADNENHRIRTILDQHAPVDFTVAFDQSAINIASDQRAVSFTFENAEVGTAFEYTISSEGGGIILSGNGIVHSSTEQIEGIDVSELGEGVLTLNVTLTDAAGNTSDPVTTSISKDLTLPTVLTTDYTAVLNESGLASITVFDIDNGSTDNLTSKEGLSLALDHSTFSSSDLGENMVTLTVTDQAGNSNSATARVTVVKRTQNITFESLPTKTYGDESFSLVATSGSGLEVSFSSSDTTVASVSGDIITIKKVGTTTINASQDGNDIYLPAESVARSFQVKKATLRVQASDQSIIYGDKIPELAYSINGFVNNENAEVLEEAPVISTTASVTSNVGDYEISVSEGHDQNYAFSYEPGTLTILKANLTVTAENTSRNVGEENPEFKLLYSGFKNDDSISDLDLLPYAICEATVNSSAGEYEIKISEGDDGNYSFSYVKGILLIEDVVVLDAEDPTLSFKAYPNPVSDNTLHIKLPKPARIKLLNLEGEVVLTAGKTHETSLQLDILPSGIYILLIDYGNYRKSVRILNP